MSSTHIHRRTLLRGLAATGAAIAIPLPRLSGMLNDNGTAYAAQGGALPQRFGLWFFGNGILFERWNPAMTGSGSSWTLSEELAPLAAVKDQLSLVTGLSIKSLISDDPHVAGAAGALTGAAALLKDEINPTIGRRVNTVQAPSIDQIIAQGITSARFRSVEVGLSKCSDPDISGTLYHNVSHSGPDAPNPPEYDPQNIFNRLFLGLSAGPDPKAALIAKAKSSVLDAVLEDARLLRPRLGASDQSRLDQHLDGIRGLERQLQSPDTSAAVCQPPAKPTLGPDTNQQATRARNDVMSQLIALALACDLTRVFSFMLAPAAGHVYFPDVNLNHDFHNYYNHDAAQQEGVHQGVVFEMDLLAAFLKQLEALPEGAGTLLDQSLIYATSDVSSGLRHEHLEFPVLFAGKAGGKLRGNTHVRASGDNYTKALVTAANLMGVTTTGIGIDTGRATQAIGDSAHVSASSYIAIALLIGGCAATADSPGSADDGGSSASGGATTQGTGGSPPPSATGSGGSTATPSEGVSGSGPSAAGHSMKDASPVDAPSETGIDAGISDPGTDGDGDFIIGPNYMNAPELTANPMAPKGTVFNFSMSSRDSAIYPGRGDLNPPGDFSRGVWVYIPKQYVDGTAGPFVVAQDGGQYGPDGRGYTGFLPTVLDNLIFEKKVPVMIAVMINPGPGDGQGSERGLEYDTVSAVYSSFIEKEGLPAVQNDSAIHKAYPNLRFTTNPEGRSAMGCSSGGAASFTMGWFRPDLYRRIVTYSGTFVDQDPKNPIYPHGAWSYGETLIAQSDPKPLRVFLAFGDNDNNLDSDPRFNNDMMHNWITANKMVSAALKAKSYHYRSLLAKGAGHCDGRVPLQTMPETLEWVWRGYPID